MSRPQGGLFQGERSRADTLGCGISRAGNWRSCTGSRSLVERELQMESCAFQREARLTLNFAMQLRSGDGRW